MNAIFEDIFATQKISLNSGTIFPLQSGITPALSAVLSDVVGGFEHPQVLEIGMACGVASVHLCDGIRRTGGGHLTSVDPHQTGAWQGAGLELVGRAKHGDIFDLIEEPSCFALPRLYREGRRFHVIFIDGWHSFDYVFVDFFFADLLLETGGLLAFHDCQYPAVAKVLRFLETHKPYELARTVALGAPRTLAGRIARPVTNAMRLLRSGFRQECRIYRKTGDRQVPSNFFERF